MSLFFNLKTLFQRLYLFMFMVCCCGVITAKSLPGYIITHNQDTIEGYVKVYHNKMLKNGFLLPGIVVETQFEQLVFKENGAKRFKTYLPKSIKGFSFKYDSKDIQFRSFKIEKYSIIPKERTRYRFLLLLCRKNKSLYFNQSRICNSNNLNRSFGFSEFSWHLHKDYYLYDESIGLQKLTNGNIRKFLICYGIEQAFLDAYDGPVDMYNLANILEIYYSKS